MENNATLHVQVRLCMSAVVCGSWHCWVCFSAVIAVTLSTGSLMLPTQSYLSMGCVSVTPAIVVSATVNCMYALFLFCRDA